MLNFQDKWVFWRFSSLGFLFIKSSLSQCLGFTTKSLYLCNAWAAFSSYLSVAVAAEVPSSRPTDSYHSAYPQTSGSVVLDLVSPTWSPALLECRPGPFLSSDVLGCYLHPDLMYQYLKNGNKKSFKSSIPPTYRTKIFFVVVNVQNLNRYL